MPEPLPPIRDFFPLSCLLHPKALQHYDVDPRVHPLSFLNPDFNPIGVQPEDLCGPLSDRLHGTPACQACPLKSSPPQTAQPIVLTCGEGLRKAVAAIVDEDKVVGYVASPAVPNKTFFTHKSN